MLKDWAQNEIEPGQTLVFVSTGALQYFYRPVQVHNATNPPGFHSITPMTLKAHFWNPYMEAEVLMRHGVLCFEDPEEENKLLSVENMFHTKPFNVEICIKGISDNRDDYFAAYERGKDIVHKLN